MFTKAHIDMKSAKAARPPRRDIGPCMQKFVTAASPYVLALRLGSSDRKDAFRWKKLATAGFERFQATH
ncbi:MAG TPA: hypothetical protein VL996_14705 [Methylocella sp.]|nr:hypothetical protein [Methylocella sp.]